MASPHADTVIHAEVQLRDVVACIGCACIYLTKLLSEVHFRYQEGLLLCAMSLNVVTTPGGFLGSYSNMNLVHSAQLAVHTFYLHLNINIDDNLVHLLFTSVLFHMCN